MQRFRRLNPRGLTDRMVASELVYAETLVARAWDDRRAAKNPSEAGGNMLDMAVADAESYEREIRNEIESRKKAGSWNPSKSAGEKVRTKLPAAPRAAPSAQGPIRQSTESPPIFIVEKGVPRAWRPGDPIY